MGVDLAPAEKTKAWRWEKARHTEDLHTVWCARVKMSRMAKEVDGPNHEGPHMPC